MHLDEDPRDQEDINVLLRQLDHPLQPLSVEAVIARAARRRPGWARWAAGILLVAGVGGVAYAIPGSPVPRWVEAVVDGIAGTRNPPAPDSVPAPVPDATAAGIAVQPSGDFTIHFSRAAEGSEARITLTGGTDVIVRAPGGSATFTSDVNRLVINNLPTSAVFEIAIPRSASRVEIEVQGRRVFLKDHDRITATHATMFNEQYVLPLSP